MNKAIVLSLLASLGACATDASTDDTDSDPQSIAVDQATTAGKHVLPIRSAAPAVSQNGILYHGGSVMTSTRNTIYYIWYGNWTNNTATSILTDFGQHIGGSPYFNINTTYTNRAGTPVTNKIRFGGSIVDSYSHGTDLDDAAIEAIVTDHVTNGDLPVNSNALYFVLASADVHETSGFCTQYCGWHYFGTIAGKRLKYSFVGNPDQCPTSCAAQQTSPNDNVGADGMASIIAHELEETVTDPFVSAWYDASGEENGDKCAWTFGSESTAPNGSRTNMTLNGKQYLIQQNWVNANGGSCAMAF